MWPYVAIDAGFALALWAMAWLNGSASDRVRWWSAALIISWLLTGPLSYFHSPHFQLFCVLVDIVMGLAAAIDFGGGQRRDRRPKWLLALVLTYAAQLMFHADPTDDAMPAEQSGVFAVQIALLCSERLAHYGRAWARSRMRARGHMFRAACSVDRRLGGPRCRPAALRRSRV